MIPVCVDLYCGLGGWAEGFLSEGWNVIGFDTERHDYGTGGYPGLLLLRDVLSIHGSELRHVHAIVASPPCQEPSYRAMPWKRAKALNEASPPHKFIELFNACFRIQREASEAAGRYIPLIVENVVEAQRWVGRADWHFGSYYLWGDIPALMPMIKPRAKVPGLQYNIERKNHNPASFNGTAAKAIKNEGGSWFNVAHNTTSGKGQNPDGRLEAHRDDAAGVKQRNGGSRGWFGEYKPTGQGSRNFSSNSSKRKAASAMIAKIPFPLAAHIARSLKPLESGAK